MSVRAMMEASHGASTMYTPSSFVTEKPVFFFFSTTSRGISSLSKRLTAGRVASMAAAALITSLVPSRIGAHISKY